MYIIIMGCGRVGVLLARIMSGEGHKVAVIDRDSQSFARLGDDFSGLMVTGSGIDGDVQRSAGAEHADAFVTATRDDNTNIMAAQVARELFHVPRVIARIYDPEREQFYHELGLETICPVTTGAFQLRNAILAGGPRRTPLGSGGLELIDFRLPDKFVGRRVRELQSPGEVRVAAIKREGLSMIPVGDTELMDGDELTIIASGASLARIRKMFSD